MPTGEIVPCTTGVSTWRSSTPANDDWSGIRSPDSSSLGSSVSKREPWGRCWRARRARSRPRKAFQRASSQPSHSQRARRTSASNSSLGRASKPRPRRPREERSRVFIKPPEHAPDAPRACRRHGCAATRVRRISPSAAPECVTARLSQAHGQRLKSADVARPPRATQCSKLGVTPPANEWGFRALALLLRCEGRTTRPSDRRLDRPAAQRLGLQGLCGAGDV